MPPPTEAERVRVELGPLRDLLAVDRNSAGEARRAAQARAAQARVQLTTTAYAMPLRVQWRRAWRKNRRLRIAVRSACLCVIAALLLWQAPRLEALALRATSYATSATSYATSATSYATSYATSATSYAASATSYATSWTKSAIATGRFLWLHASTPREGAAGEDATTP